MKYIIVLFFAFLALANAGDFRVRTQDDLIKARKECVEAKKVPEAHVEKFKKFEFPDDEITRCYLQCIFEKLDFFDARGGFHKANLLDQFTNGKTISDPSIRDNIAKCADNNEQKSDSCTWVYRGFKCFLQNNLKLVQDTIKKN